MYTRARNIIYSHTYVREEEINYVSPKGEDSRSDDLVKIITPFSISILIGEILTIFKKLFTTSRVVNHASSGGANKFSFSGGGI